MIKLKTGIFTLVFYTMLFEGIAIGKNLTEGLTPKELELYKDISGDLRCPTCTGLSILQSDAEFSVQMKEAVRSQVLTGKKKDQIIDYFTERYGLWILREPPSKGVHLLAWVIPGALLLLGPLIIWVFVWRKRQTVKTYGIRSTNLILEEMETELKKLKNTQVG